MVKNPPANVVDPRDLYSILDQENPLEEEMATQSSILRGGHKELDTTGQLTKVTVNSQEITMGM